MQTPKFWIKKNFISNLLLPLGYIYGSMTGLRLAYKKSGSVDKQVICVGNISAGGTGKTPVAISIAKILQKQNLNPAFVSRGYGANLTNVIVDNNIHSATDVGDEPMLLSSIAPTVINANRFQGALMAINNNANVIIMDDGFQNPSLKKDISFVVVDGKYGFGNERCIPAGPLREFLSKGIDRASAIILLGDDNHNIQSKAKNKPIFRAEICPIIPQISNPNIIAFAGIGHPDKLYSSLKSIGFKIIETIDFPDHHKYSHDELMNIVKLANNKNADIYTTSKDFVKIPKELQPNFKVLEITVKWQDEDLLTKFITNNA